MKAFNVVEITIEPKMVTLEASINYCLTYFLINRVVFQWVANPVNDMYADAIVAAVLQADLLDTPSKSMAASVKVDRMHFKVTNMV